LTLRRCKLRVAGTKLFLSLLMAQSAMNPLPSAGASAGTSVSGISSGADFAVYFSIAHSASVRGAGVFAGNAYRCYSTRFPADPVVPCASLLGSKANYSIAGCDNVDPHQGMCDDSQPGTLPCPKDYGLPLSKCQGCDGLRDFSANVNVSTLAAIARQHAAAGSIDDVANIAANKYYLYRGGADACYSPRSVRNAADLYTQLGSGDVMMAMNATVHKDHCCEFLKSSLLFIRT